MTDRYFALSVALENDIRSDDAESLISAIKQLRGVLMVEPVVSDLASYVAEQRARRELGEKIIDIIYPNRRYG